MFHATQSIFKTFDILGAAETQKSAIVPHIRDTYIPLWRIAFLLDLGEDALGLVIDTVGTGGHLAIAFNLLFPTHVAGLYEVSLAYSIPPKDADGRL